MQISLGNIDLQCFGYKCDVCVDKVIIIVLVFIWYDKFLLQKINKVIEFSLELRWCFFSKCVKIFKVFIFGVMVNRSSLVFVVCFCGGFWCFQCGRNVYWLVLCVGEVKFQEFIKYIYVEIEQKKKDFIILVMVRNCLNCYYLIEKYFGCSFMYCIMCQIVFCWECLIFMSKYQGECK